MHKFYFNYEKRCEMRKVLKLENKKVIAHVGSFNKQKNQSFIIDVLEELIKIDPKYHVILVGDGNERNNIEYKINEKNLNENISLLGRRTDIADILQAADLMLLPSFYEGLPVVVIEWQALGLKSIVSSYVTSEVKLTELVNFMDLEEGAKKWALKIEKELEYEREGKYCDKLSEAGYDVSMSVNKLIEIYYGNYNKYSSI